MTEPIPIPAENLPIDTTISQPYPDEMFEEGEKRERSNRIIERYNQAYNTECSGLTHGTPITPEHHQAITLECMLSSLTYDNANVTEVSIADVNDLIQRLYQQSDQVLKMFRELKGEE
jgi:hypothetical protein